MARLVGLLLACLFAATPSVDVLCKAACTPVEAAQQPCHEMGPVPSDGRLTSTASCQREAVLAAPPDLRRGPLAAAVVSVPVVWSHGSGDPVNVRWTRAAWAAPRDLARTSRNLVLRI